MTGMTRLALLLVLTASPAFADVAAMRLRMTLVPADPPCLAMIEVENRAGVYNEVETLPTEAGPVSVRYETVGGHNPEDHDLVEVVSTPDGVVAVPMNMELPDGETRRICVMKYEGM